MTGAVTASTRAAAEAGGSVLEAGGNAVDAAVATALASCVADPCNTGLGGYGGHMVVAEPGAEPVTLDFNMWIPRENAGSAVPTGARGPAASVIPNVVAGLERALAEWGTLNWAAASAPALALAKDGVEADDTIRAAFGRNEGAAFLDECFETETRPGDGLLARFRQPLLAATLEQMTSEGPRWFYEGPVGDAATAILRNAGHRITTGHWRRAPEAVILQPAPRLDIDGVTLASAPLGTSGSLSMFATVAAGAGIARAQPLDTPQAVVAWARALAASWSYRFGTVEGNAASADGIEAWLARALAFRQSVTAPPATGHTCHLNACDARGALVAMTLTHGPSWFGARWAVPETGVIMNAGGALLAAVPKLVGPRAYGITNMAPTIARTPDGGRLAIGTPGGRRIPTIVGLALVRHLFGGLDLEQAIRRGRFHAESHDLITLEVGRWDDGVAAAGPFRKVGAESGESYYGPCSAIARAADGALEIGLDDRWPSYAAHSETKVPDGPHAR